MERPKTPDYVSVSDFKNCGEWLIEQYANLYALFAKYGQHLLECAIRQWDEETTDRFERLSLGMKKAKPKCDCGFEQVEVKQP